jgi:hypothetical protein
MYIRVNLYCRHLIILWLCHLGKPCTVFVLICTVVVLYCFVRWVGVGGGGCVDFEMTEVFLNMCVDFVKTEVFLT